MYEKLKSFLANDVIFTVILLVLVSVISFGLGRESLKVENDKLVSSAQAGISVLEPSENVDNKAFSTESNKVKVVASKSGAKYHLITCPGASQIKEENKIFFDSDTFAESAGYLPAANCPGL